MKSPNVKQRKKNKLENANGLKANAFDETVKPVNSSINLAGYFQVDKHRTTYELFGR